jgi:hypothetical protein
MCTYKNRRNRKLINKNKKEKNIAEGDTRQTINEGSRQNNIEVNKEGKIKCGRKNR